MQKAINYISTDSLHLISEMTSLLICRKLSHLKFLIPLMYLPTQVDLRTRNLVTQFLIRLNLMHRYLLLMVVFFRGQRFRVLQNIHL